MRRIQNQEEIERKNKRRTIILSIIMLLLLLISTIGFAFLSAPDTSSNNQNINPQAQNQRSEFDSISFQYQGAPINLISTYNDIKNITIDTTITPESYSGNILYIDASNQGILQEIGSTIGRFASRAQEACYGKCEKNLPEKNCTDNMIVWKESPQNKVYQQDKCVFIEGDMRAVDAFIYKLFGSP